MTWPKGKTRGSKTGGRKKGTKNKISTVVQEEKIQQLMREIGHAKFICQLIEQERQSEKRTNESLTRKIDELERAIRILKKRIREKK